MCKKSIQSLKMSGKKVILHENWDTFIKNSPFLENILSENKHDILFQMQLKEKSALRDPIPTGVIRLYSDAFVFPHGRARARFRRNIRRVLLDAADKTLRKPDMPDIQFKLNVTNMMDGSIEIWFAITVVGGGLYAFFKDYTDLRAGVIQFSRDIVMFSEKIRRIFKKYSGKSKKK